MQNVEESKPAVSEDDITALFNEFDRDGNGYISPREAKRAYKKLSQHFNIEKVDVNMQLPWLNTF